MFKKIAQQKYYSLYFFQSNLYRSELIKLIIKIIL